MTATLQEATTVRHLTTDLLDEFATWCSEERGDYALDVREGESSALRRLAFGAGDGTAWVVDGHDLGLVAASLRATVRSRVRWWAHDATGAAVAVHAATGLRLRGLFCTKVMARTVSPAAFIEGDVSLTATDTAARAIECARLVATTRLGTSSALRGIAVRECKVDDLWRWPAVRGYRVDTEALTEEVTRLEAAKTASVRDHGIDLTRETDDVRRWLVTRGIHVMDPGGKPTLSHKAYGRVTPSPAAAADWKMFVELREAASVANKVTEIVGALSRAGRLHPTIHGIGAVTGRTSITGPALQNLPARLRPLFLAEPGMVLVGCDLDRVEPRVVAAISGDPALTEAVRGDVYTELAVAVWGEATRGDAARRKIAKTAFLAMIYGEGPASLASNLGVTEVAARGVIQGLHRAYPVMSKWMEDVKRRAKNGESLETAYGRPLPPTPEAAYRAVNWIIQGTAADLFKIITIAAAERLGRDSLWLPIHDELIAQVPEAEGPAAAKALGEVMTTDLNGVAITGTAVVLGARWGKETAPRPDTFALLGTPAITRIPEHPAVSILPASRYCRVCGAGRVSKNGLWECDCDF